MRLLSRMPLPFACSHWPLSDRRSAPRARTADRMSSATYMSTTTLRVEHDRRV